MIPRLSRILVSLALCVCSAGYAFQDPPLRIAYIDAVSGTMASLGLPYLRQLEFEAERINREGGINGHEVQIVVLDNKLDPQTSLIQLQKAIDGDIHFVTQALGSAVASALLTGIEKHNRRNPDRPMLYLNLAALDPAFTNERCSFWHFRFFPHEEMIVNSLTDWIAADQKAVKNVALLNQDYSFGHMFSELSQKMLAEKRPDISVVDDIFIPLAKVKDFTPYISRMKGAGADAVVTSNWGADMSLLVKAAADYGFDVPFLTYAGGSPGSVTEVREQGIDRLYTMGLIDGAFPDEELGARQLAMYQQTGYDYILTSATYLLEMVRAAAEKAGSIAPTDIAFALEDVRFELDGRQAYMRAQDHQIMAPIFISVLQDNVPYGAEGTTLGFKSIKVFSAEQVEVPTNCAMERPER